MQENLETFFGIKKQIRQLKESLDDQITVLSQDFDNYFYFKTTYESKLIKGKPEKVTGELFFAFYIPYIENNHKYVTHIEMSSPIQLGNPKSLQLVGFTDFNVNIKTYKINNKLASLLLYPDVLDFKLLEIPDYPGNLDKKIPYEFEHILDSSMDKKSTIEKYHINEGNFIDFCKKIQHERMIPFIQNNSFFSNDQIPQYILPEKIQKLLIIKLSVHLNQLVNTLTSEKNTYVKMTDPQHTYITKSLKTIEKKRTFNHLDRQLPEKTNLTIKAKL